MFCSNCGAKNNDGAKFCNSCGGELSVVNNEENVTPPTEPKKKNTAIIAIVIAIFCVIGFVLGAVVTVSIINSEEVSTEMTMEKNSEESETKKEYKIVYNYKIQTIHGKEFPIAIDEKGRVIFKDNMIVYYALDDQGNVIIEEGNTPKSYVLNKDIFGHACPGVVIENTLYLPYLSCKIPDGSECSVEDPDGVHILTSDGLHIINFRPFVGYNSIDEAFVDYVQYMESNGDAETVVMDNITLPGTNFNAKKAYVESSISGRVVEIFEFYVFETSTGIYLVQIEASHTESYLDFEEFIEKNVTIY